MEAEKIFFKGIKRLFGPRALFPAALLFLALAWFGSSILTRYYFDNRSVEEKTIEEASGVGGGNENDLLPDSASPTFSFLPLNVPEISGYFPDDLAIWSYEDFYHQPRNEQMCAKADTGYKSPAMWLNEKVPLVFDEIQISFVAFPSQEDESLLAPVVLFWGNYEDIPLFRCQVLENSLMQIGCYAYDSTVTDGEPLRRTSTYYLKKGPVKPNSEVNIDIQAISEPGGFVRYTLSLEFESVSTGNREEEGMEIGTIKSPYQNLDEARAQFGLGTVERECIKPKSYSVFF